MAGSAQIGNLQVRLGIDTAQFSAGVNAAQSKLGALGKSLKAFAIGAAGALSLGAVANSLKSAANRMDDLGKAAQRIGIPVAELSKLEYAARLADVSLEDLTSGTAKFSKALAEIAAGGKNSASAALDALGISAVDSNGKLRPTIEIYGDIADRFSKMQDGAGKTAIALALIPKSGANLIPFFNGGKQAIESASAELERFGGVVTPEAAKRAEQFNDNLTRLQQAADGITQQIAEALLPAVIDLTESFLTFLNTGTPVVDMVEALKNWFAELAPFIESTRKEVEMLTNAYDKFMGYFGSGPTEIEIGTKYDPLSSIRQQPTRPPAKTEPPTLNLGTGSTKKKTTDTNGLLTDYNREDWQVSAETFASEINTANEAVLGLADSITNSLGDSLAGLIDGTMSFKDAWANMAQSLIDSLADITMQLLKSGLMQLLGTAGASLAPQTGIGGFGGYYAEGGTLGAGKWGIAGENGPEIVRGPASISPMGGGSTQVNIYNQGGGQVEQRRRRGSGGQDIVDVYIRGVARDEAMKTQRKTLPGMYGTPASLVSR